MSNRGFTLIELVVAIAISSIVVVFAAMFISAPLAAYDTHSRRAVLVADTSGAWPRMQGDLRSALPNSLRTGRNGNFVVIEMLPVLDMARYMTVTTAMPITVAGLYRGAGAPAYLSVNNLGTPGRDAYTLGPTMVAASNWPPAAAWRTSAKTRSSRVIRWRRAESTCGSRGRGRRARGAARSDPR